MGCDYYIVKELYILYKKHAEGKQKEKSIELDRQRCYFSEYAEDVSCDSDDSDYWPRVHARQNAYIKECLHVTFQPRILYENQTWKNEETRKKYEDMIQKELNGPYELVSIVKREVRYLR
jgi:hypothetical protein